MPSFRQNRRALIDEQLAKSRPSRIDRHAIQVAAQACRPIVTTDIPQEIMELAFIIEHSSRMPDTYPGHAKARAIVARGVPVGVMTRRDGSSSAPVMLG